MKLFDYSELIRVIDNVEIREEKERNMALNSLKERYRELKRTMIESGIFEDWNRLKELCDKAKIRLCVSHQGNMSIGCILHHPEDFKYCKEYQDNGNFKRIMSSGSSWCDYFGFNYSTERGISWHITHTTNTRFFYGFGKDDEENEYKTKIDILETFKNTYEDYRNFQLKKIEDKFGTRIKAEDIIK